MSLDRVASLYKPFFYKQNATPRLAQTFCVFITLFCITVAAPPFAGVGRYISNKSSGSFCQFHWFPVDHGGTVYIPRYRSVWSPSHFADDRFVIVVRIRRRLLAVLPSEMNARRHARQMAFRQEERMAKFVALVSVVFLVTWLPVTVRPCAVMLTSKQICDCNLYPPVLFDEGLGNDHCSRATQVFGAGQKVLNWVFKCKLIPGNPSLENLGRVFQILTEPKRILPLYFFTPLPPPPPPPLPGAEGFLLLQTVCSLSLFRFASSVIHFVRILPTACMPSPSDS